MARRGAVSAQASFVLSTFAVLAAVPAAHALKYQQWFYWYNRDGTLSNLSTGVCKSEVQAYWQAATYGAYNGSNAVQWCYLAEDCLLANMRPSYIQNYQAGAVILGILPTLLATLGPRIAEVSLLSTHRPFLSFLLSIGAPSVWPTRIFTYDDPATCAGRGVNRVDVPPQPLWRARLLSIVQYVLVIASIANLFQVSVELGSQTILSWACTLDYGLLAWALIPLAIHTVAAASYNFEISSAEKRIRREAQNGDTPRSPLIRSMTFLHKRAELSWLAREFTICANQPKGLELLLKEKKMSPAAVFMNCTASLMAFFHLLFGTMLFSSLVFIAVWDIMNSILWRYLLSTAICRLILLVELAGMREPGLKDTDELEMKVHGLRDRFDGVASKVDTLMEERDERERPSVAYARSSLARRNEKIGSTEGVISEFDALSLEGAATNDRRAVANSVTEVSPNCDIP